MNNKNIKSEIFSAVSLCGYPPNVIGPLIELITEIMNYPNVKSPSEYKIKTINQEKIIAIRCPLEVPFNKRDYEVPIVIFFSKFIPLEPPKIFLEVSHGSAINPKTKDVDIHSRKIVTPSLISWNHSSNFTNILNEIKNSFSKTFPIYKVKKTSLPEIESRPTLNTIDFNNDDSIRTTNTININNNNAVFNFVSNNSINNMNMNSKMNNTSPNNDPFANIASIFTENFIGNNTNNGFNFSLYNNNNNGFQNSTQNNQIMNMSGKFNNNMNNNFNNQIQLKENIVKNILVESVFDKISSKLISEYKKLNQQNKTLNNYRNQFRNENEKMKKYIEKKQEITNRCTKDLYQLNNEIKKYEEYLKKKKDNKITDQNCLEYIKVENPLVLRCIADEISYEELLVMIKKGFEKKKITFQEAISATRDAARNYFISKEKKEKGIKYILKSK